jgi:hypothetical protein
MFFDFKRILKTRIGDSLIFILFKKLKPMVFLNSKNHPTLIQTSCSESKKKTFSKFKKHGAQNQEIQALAKKIYPMLMEYSLKQGVSYKYGPFGIP